MADSFNTPIRENSPTSRIDLNMTMKSAIKNNNDNSNNLMSGEYTNLNRSMMSTTSRGGTNYFGQSFADKNPLNTSKAK